jgi:shikimate dehydrogenase
MKRVYLIGHPLSHSVSPAMHNAAFSALEMDWQYDLLDAPHEKLPEVLARIRAEECMGANVTVPHKRAVVEILDEVTDNARQIGAVNTIVRRNGKLIGDNTDGCGFINSLREIHIHPRNASVVILGAGGAASAIAHALANEGAHEIVINNRTGVRAAELADRLHEEFPKMKIAVNWTDAIANANILVNATSVGMAPKVAESPMPRGACFSPRLFVIDLIYNPMETRFLSDAKRARARTSSGLGMLVHQGAAAFRMWTGREPPIDEMRAAAVKALRARG